MRPPKPTLFLFVAAATVALATCHADQQCYLATDCPSNFYCVVDNSGWGHCVAAAEVFGIQQDSGPLPTCSDAGASEVDSGTDAGPKDAGVDAGLDAGAGDAGVDAGEDAGTVDAGLDAGSDAGELPDAGDAGA